MTRSRGFRVRVLAPPTLRSRASASLRQAPWAAASTLPGSWIAPPGPVERVLPTAQGIVLERGGRARWERQPSVEPRWRIELFGGLRAVRAETVVTRFRTQNSALLLAHLALSGAGGPRRQRSLLRDELANQLWPESELRAGRTSLRHALSLVAHLSRLLPFAVDGKARNRDK